MNNKEAKILCGDDLLNCEPSDYKNIPLTMSRSSDTIGIATDDNGTYYVYQKGERNMVDWKKPFGSFDSALEYAIDTYKDYLEYLKYLYGEDASKSTEKEAVIYDLNPATKILVSANNSFLNSLSTHTYTYTRTRNSMLLDRMELFLRCAEMDDRTIENLMQAVGDKEIESVGIIVARDGIRIAEVEFCIDWDKYESILRSEGDWFNNDFSGWTNGIAPEAYIMVSILIRCAKQYNLAVSSWIRLTPWVRNNTAQNKYICNKLGYTVPFSMLKWRESNRSYRTNNNADGCFIKQSFISPQEKLASKNPNS